MDDLNFKHKTRLQEYIEQNSISVKRLSRLCGIDYRTARALVNGECLGQMYTWYLIADKLGVDVSQIVGFAKK